MASLAKRYAGTLPLNSIFRRFEQNLDVSRDQVIAAALLSLRLSHFEKVRDLLVPLLREVLRSFSGRCAWIGVRADVRGPFDWTLGLTDQGQPCDRPTLSETMETRIMSDGLYICCPEVPNPGVLSAMGAPLICSTGALGMLYVENDGGEPFGPRALDAISALACSAAIPIESVVRQSVAKRQVAAGMEITMARATQDALTPRAMPQWTDLQVAAYRHMGAARCCDYYDILQLADKSASLIVARLNVEGLSVPRYFSEVRAAFRCAALHGDAPHLFTRSVNWLLAGGKAEHTVDLVAVTIAPASGKVHFCQAGDGVHVGVIQPDGTCRKIQAAHGGPLGQARSGELDVRSLDLAGEETLVLTSDGFRSARNADGEIYGLEGLEESLCDGVGTAPGPALSEFASDLAEFLEGGQCPEDLTVVLARRN
jgi:serine phosphatase RsbU (regulator of sigma subunit)